MKVPSLAGLGLTPLFGHVLQPMLSAWRGQHHRRHVGTYEQLFQLSRDDLLERQLQDLRHILRHAQHTTPFYGRRFAEYDFDPRTVSSLEDLKRIPSLSRADVTLHCEEMVSTRYTRSELVTRTTGGTTSGRPVVFFQDREAIARKNAIELVLRRTMGWKPGIRAGWIWAATQDREEDVVGLLGPAKRFVTDLIRRETAFDARVLDDAICDTILEEFARFRPHAVQGYPVATDVVARRALETGRRLRIPLVVLTAEQVLPDQRERIAEAFGANVLSFYGSRENGWIAFDHPETKEMLINTAGVVLETDPDSGELYVTDLLNHGFPLIRYEIGDRVTLSDEPARSGDPRPVMASVDGRLADIIRLPDGRLIPGMLVDGRGLVRDAHSVLFVQIVQNEIDTVDVYYVPAPAFRQEALDAFLEVLDKKFVGAMRFRAHAVARIEPGPNGKVRSVICNVNPDGSPKAEAARQGPTVEPLA